MARPSRFMMPHGSAALKVRARSLVAEDPHGQVAGLP